MNKIKNAIRTIPNFPIDGIMFRDVTTLYSNSEAMKEVIKLTCNYWKNKGLTIIALGGMVALLYFIYQRKLRIFFSIIFSWKAWLAFIIVAFPWLVLIVQNLGTS